MKRNSSVSRFPFHLVLAVCTFVMPAFAQAASTVNVDCSNPKAKVKTIAAGLAQVPLGGPSTLLVSGTCHENVTIDGYNLLTVQGNPTATIDGGTDPNFEALGITRSNVTLTNLVISGGGAGGLACVWLCNALMDHVTIQDSLDVGLIVVRQASARLNMGTIENNACGGVSVTESTLVLRGGTIQGNGTNDCGGNGVSVGSNGTLFVFLDSTGTVPAVIQNNLYGNGISVSNSSTVNTSQPTISGNGGDGIALDAGSVAQIGNTTITGNGLHGVRIGNLSFASFNGASNSITSNLTGPQVVCDGQFAATRRAAVVDPGTNCPAEPAPIP